MKRTTVIVALCLSVVACKRGEKKAEPVAPAAKAPTAPAAATRADSELIKALPESGDVNMDKVILGRALFHDTILSANGTVSCASCHMLDHGGAEPRKTSLGINDQVGPINSPTVLNASFNFVQFWDGRAKDLQEQAAGPVENPIEMGAKWDNVVERIAAKADYKEPFAKLYSDGVTKNNVTDAIAEYEKSLITPSRFDVYLRGDDNAITAAEKAGYETFKEVGCTTCHIGTNAGGTMFQKMGLVKNYFEMRGGKITEADLGRYNVTKNDVDKHFFKVPTLRNVELTPPYFHDGSQDTLEGSVKIMGQVQLGRDLTDDQVNSIVAFLKSLTGKLPDHAKMPKG